MNPQSPIPNRQSVDEPDIKRPDGWTPRGWASRLEYLAGQVERDAERFGPVERERKLKLAVRFRAAAEKEIRTATVMERPQA